MGIVTDHDQELKARDEKIEELEHALTALRTAIAEHCEAFGLQSFDASGLYDVRHQIERLLEGKDLDNGIEYPGITGEVEALVWLAQFAGTDGVKTKKYFARLSYPKAHAVRMLPKVETYRVEHQRDGLNYEG